MIDQLPFLLLWGVGFSLIAIVVHLSQDKWWPYLSEKNNYINRNFKLLIAFFSLISFAILSSKLSFIQDDAYISFRYSYNLVHHQSLSWNIADGPIVQGYTNFLWTIICAIPIALGIKIEVFIQFIGIFLGFSTLLVVYKLALEVIKSNRKAYIATFLLATNFSFISYSTGGLETQLVTLLVTSSWLLSFIINKILTNKSDFIVRKKLFNLIPYDVIAIYSLAISTVLAFLTRMDSILILAPCIVFTYYCIAAKNNCPGKVFKILSLTFVIVLGIGLYFGFVYLYYGSLLPNTFYVKAGSFNIKIIAMGVLYLLQFCLLYGIIPLFLFTVLANKNPIKIDLKQMLQNGSLFLFGSIILPLLYIVRVGGDFMEFRFLVPLLPLFFVLVVHCLGNTTPRVLRTAVVALPIISMANIVAPRYVGVESIRSLNDRMDAPYSNWVGIGKKLQNLFPSDPRSVVIGVSAAGAIPYYSRLKTVDLLGLNDPYIAKNGVKISFRPGHTNGPTYDYLEKSEINLLIGHPRMRQKEVKFNKQSFLSSFEWLFMPIDFQNLIKSNFLILTIPIDTNYELDLIYLKPTKSVDNAISSGKIRIIGYH